MVRVRASLSPLRAVLRPGVSRLREAQLRFAFRRRPPEVPAGVPACYFCDTERPVHGVLSGGAVKLLPLARRYPGTRDRFNVLYLVNSVQRPHLPVWAVLAAGAGAAVVLNQNGVAYPAWAGSAYRRINEYNARLLQAATAVVYQSEFSRRSCRLWVGETEAPSVVLHNPVDVAYFRPREEPLPARPLVILAAGSHEEPYRVEAAVAAVAALRRGGLDCRLHLAGRVPWDTSAGRAVARLAAVHGLGSYLVRSDAYQRADAPALFQGAHLLLHLKDKDPCPTVVLEAMASGLPVVGLASGGMPELVPPAAGRLLPATEDWDELYSPAPEAVAETVAAVADALGPMAAAARGHAELAFAETRWLAAHDRLLEEALGRR